LPEWRQKFRNTGSGHQVAVGLGPGNREPVNLRRCDV
jgi:hypothetical protein